MTAPARTDLQYAAVKVPEIGLLFWVIKLLTTGMGEAASDWLGSFSPLLLVLGVLVAIALFVLTLRLQFRATEYSAVVYWSAVAMVAVFGTTAADAVHVGLAVPYSVSSTFWALVVAACFIRWYRVEGTLSIHSITTRRRERFYWVTVFATFALGTALGDLTAAQMKLGFLPSAYVFGAVILVPLVAWRWFRLNSVVAFWFAYVDTRPLGASIADWLGKPHSIGSGLGLGDGTVTGAALVLIAAGVAYAAVTRCDVQITDRSAESGKQLSPR